MWMKVLRFSSRCEPRTRPVSEIPASPQRSSPLRTQQVGTPCRRSCLFRESFWCLQISSGLLHHSAGVPSPPLEVAVPDASRQHITVTWKPPAKDGGCPVTGYHVEVAEARPELKWLRVNSRPVKEAQFRIDDGIKPEKKYVIRIRAINSVGVSDPSEITDKVFTKDPDCKYRHLHTTPRTASKLSTNDYLCPLSRCPHHGTAGARRSGGRR